MLAKDSASSSLHDGLQEIAQAFLLRARVPPTNHTKFSSFMHLLACVWIDTVQHPRDASVEHLVVDVRKKVSALSRQLEELLQGHEELINRFARRETQTIYLEEVDPSQPRFSAGAVNFDRLERSQPTAITCALTALVALDDFLGQVVYPSSGRRKGNKHYPGLEVLVWAMESAARHNRGKFTLNKRDRKGTLIEALNWLRAHCKAKPEWGFLADALPTPDKHPLSIYERVLQDVRRLRRQSPEN